MSLDITELLNALLELGSFGLILAAFLVILFKVKDITSIHDYLTSRKNKAIIEAINSGLITDKSAGYLKESVENNLYKNFEGVNWDKSFREKLLDLREKSNGQITFNKIKRAVIFIESKDGSLVVKINCLEKVFLRVSLIMGILMLLMAISVFVLFVLGLESEITTATSMSQFFARQASIVFLAFLFMFASIWLMREGQSLKFALEIDQILSKNERYQSEVENCNIRSLLNSLWQTIKSVGNNIKSIY